MLTVTNDTAIIKPANKIRIKFRLIELLIILERELLNNKIFTDFFIDVKAKI